VKYEIASAPIYKCVRKSKPQRTPPTFKQKIKKTNQPGSGAGSTYTQSEFTLLFVVALNSIQMAYFIMLPGFSSGLSDKQDL